jgi:hypothetical protein
MRPFDCVIEVSRGHPRLQQTLEGELRRAPVGGQADVRRLVGVHVV